MSQQHFSDRRSKKKKLLPTDRPFFFQPWSPKHSYFCFWPNLYIAVPLQSCSFFLHFFFFLQFLKQSDKQEVANQQETESPPIKFEPRDDFTTTPDSQPLIKIEQDTWIPESVNKNSNLLLTQTGQKDYNDMSSQSTSADPLMDNSDGDESCSSIHFLDDNQHIYSKSSLFESHENCKKDKKGVELLSHSETNYGSQSKVISFKSLGASRKGKYDLQIPGNLDNVIYNNESGTESVANDNAKSKEQSHFKETPSIKDSIISGFRLSNLKVLKIVLKRVDEIKLVTDGDSNRLKSAVKKPSRNKSEGFNASMTQDIDVAMTQDIDVAMQHEDVSTVEQNHTELELVEDTAHEDDDIEIEQYTANNNDKIELEKDTAYKNDDLEDTADDTMNHNDVRLVEISPVSKVNVVFFVLIFFIL